MELSAAGAAPLRLEPQGRTCRVVLARPEAKNRLSMALIEGLHRAIDQALAEPETRLLLIAGEGGWFSDGMDFAEAVASRHATVEAAAAPIHAFADLLRRMAEEPLIVAAEIDGRANAGGVGLAAAADLVLASPRSRFSLSEILFGLVPAVIAPYLLRRIGAQPLRRMALTGQLVDAAEARAIGLVDELAEPLEDGVRRLRLRSERLSRAAIQRMKRHLATLAPIDEAVRRHAAETILALVQDPEVLAGIRRFEQEGRLS